MNISIFSRKKNIKTDTVKDELRSIFAQRAATTTSPLLSAHYISKLWLHKLKHFGEPGPIDLSSFLCIAHHSVLPNVWRHLDAHILPCSTDTWSYLVDTYGVKYDAAERACTLLYPCAECQRIEEMLRQRQTAEKTAFIRLREKWNQEQVNCSGGSGRVFAISQSWFKQWEQFVQQQQQALVIEVPGKIDNMPICVKPSSANSNNANTNVGATTTVQPQHSSSNQLRKKKKQSKTLEANEFQLNSSR
jgi:hypothetical protein